MDAALRAAAESGNPDLLYTSIQGNPSLLAQIDNELFVETPLHLAAALGHTHFALEIMRLRPSYAKKLDLNGFTPLHLAAKKRKHMVINQLVGVDSDLVRVQGREGITPLHIVAEEGNLVLLNKFLSVCIESIQDVTIRGETALHLAVKKHQFEAFNLLVKNLRRFKEYDVIRKQILNCTDAEGNSLLHIAARTNQPKVVRQLLFQGVEVSTENSYRLTALDIAEQQTGVDNTKVKKLLGRSGKLISNACRFISNNNMTEERRNALLIVATLILTSTYQAALSPPGGLWQDFGDNGNNSNDTTRPIRIREQTSPQIAGRVVMNKKDFSDFWILNTLTLYYTMACICFALPAITNFIDLYLYVPFGLLFFGYGSAMSTISRDVIGRVAVLNYIFPALLFPLILVKAFIGMRQ